LQESPRNPAGLRVCLIACVRLDIESSVMAT
jgi:hypothetical protein